LFVTNHWPRQQPQHRTQPGAANPHSNTGGFVKILSLIPAADPGDGPTKLLAKFDVEVSADIRLFNMRLIEIGDRRLSYPSSTGGRRNATFSAKTADQITAAASAALLKGRDTQHDRRT
jgi:hypothetical protein